MPKSTIAAIAVALSLTAPVAYAQNFAAPAGQASGHPVQLLTVALTTQSGELRASQLLGSTVYDVQNRNIGSIKDIVLDRDGKVVYKSGRGPRGYKTDQLEQSLALLLLDQETTSTPEDNDNAAKGRSVIDRIFDIFR